MLLYIVSGIVFLAAAVFSGLAARDQGVKGFYVASGMFLIVGLVDFLIAYLKYRGL